MHSGSTLNIEITTLNQHYWNVSPICLANLFIFTDIFDEHSSGPDAFDAPDVTWF